jgi:hypothetical protein
VDARGVHPLLLCGDYISFTVGLVGKELQKMKNFVLSNFGFGYPWGDVEVDAPKVSRHVAPDTLGYPAQTVGEGF